MPNVNRVTGLAPVKYLNGADWTGQGNVYSILTSETNVLSIGDLVKLGGSADANGIPNVVQGTAGATAVGAILAIGINPGGPYIDPNNLNLIQAPATKLVSYYALVADDPNTIFEIQEAGAGSNLAVTDVGQNADIVAAAPATGAKLSGMYLDNNAHDTSVTKNLKILRLVPRVDNAIGQYAKWQVLINNHSFRAGITGI